MISFFADIGQAEAYLLPFMRIYQESLLKEYNVQLPLKEKESCHSAVWPTMEHASCLFSTRQEAERHVQTLGK